MVPKRLPWKSLRFAWPVGHAKSKNPRFTWNTHFGGFNRKMLEILDFEHFRKMMKINTKVLIFRDLHILAVFSQNMVFGNTNVMTFTHNIGSEKRKHRFTQNQHKSVDFGRFRKWPTRGSVIFGRFLDQPLADTHRVPFFYYSLWL